jgi:hypothetical protein
MAAASGFTVVFLAMEAAVKPKLPPDSLVDWRDCRNGRLRVLNQGAETMQGDARGKGLLRMADDIDDVVNTVHNSEVESPVFVHARLPEIVRLIVFFRVEGRVAQVLDQKQRLLIEGPLDSLWRFGVTALEPDAADELHRTARLGFLLSFFASL